MSIDGKLTRIESNPDHGTFGVLTLNTKAFCVTLEPYWRKNKRGISCIPEDFYICRPYVSPKYGNVYLLEDVKSRSMIEIHPGNLDDHTRGCILLGEHFGKLRCNRAILNSGKTFKKFLDVMGGKDLVLNVTSSY